MGGSKLHSDLLLRFEGQVYYWKRRRNFLKSWWSLSLDSNNVRNTICIGNKTLGRRMGKKTGVSKRSFGWMA